MLKNKFKVPVIVVEPESHLQAWVVKLCARLWAKRDILPRSNGKELLTASKWLDCEVLVVRTSTMRSDTQIASVVLDMVAKGCRLICLQDTSHAFSVDRWLTLGRMHFVSYSAHTTVLEELLLSCRLDSIANNELASSDSVE